MSLFLSLLKNHLPALSPSFRRNFLFEPQSGSKESLIRNPIFLLTTLLLLTACGFSPIYGSHDAASVPVAKALGNVAIESIADHNGQFLRNKLIDRMYEKGRPEKPQARLHVVLSTSEVAIGVQKDATTTRSQIRITAAYELSDLDGNELHKGRAYSVASYNKLAAQYGTVASQRNAYERALGEISEQIVNNLSLYYAEKATTTPAEKPAAKAALPDEPIRKGSKGFLPAAQ